MQVKTHGQIIKQIYRKWGYAIALKLKKTPITANQVTLSRLIIIVFASLSIISGGNTLNFVAAILIILFSMFDALDGSLAMLKNEKSIVGSWLDPQIDRTGFLILFIAIAYKLQLSDIKYVYLTFYTLIMFYFRGLISADIRLKDKFSSINGSFKDSKANKLTKNEFTISRLLKNIHLQICPHTHNVALYISIGILFNYTEFIIIYLSLYLSLWYLWENIRVIKRAHRIDKSKS